MASCKKAAIDTIKSALDREELYWATDSYESGDYARERIAEARKLIDNLESIACTDAETHKRVLYPKR